jgi:6-phosphogluconolactonase
MKKLTLLFALILLFSCQKSKMKEEIVTNFYVGTYTNGDSKGIYKYELSAEGKLKQIGLMAATSNPSFLAKSNDDKTLFAVDEANEEGTGFVKSFSIEKDSLLLISKSKSGGAHPCFITVNEKNQVLVANYSGGNVGFLQADTSGNLSPLLYVQQHTGKGTTDRQTAPHAHSTWFHPAKKEIISVDLGSNELWFSKIDTTNKELVFTDQKTVQMPEGAGPRHLTFHPNHQWIYVLNELNNTVSLVKEKEDSYYVDTSISIIPEGYAEYTKGADIHISKDGQFLYASNRGHNSIVIFKVNAENGSLNLVGFEPVKGGNPRNFSLSSDNKFLLVANRDTNNMVSFKRDEITGTLTFVDEVTAPDPVCILF